MILSLSVRHSKAFLQATHETLAKTVSFVNEVQRSAPLMMLLTDCTACRHAILVASQAMTMGNSLNVVKVSVI